MQKKILTLCLVAATTIVSANDLTVVLKSSMPASAMQGQPIHATYTLQNNLNKTVNAINIKTNGVLNMGTCADSLAANSQCDFQVSVTPQSVGDLAVNQTIGVNINHNSLLNYNYNYNYIVDVTAPPKPTPTSFKLISLDMSQNFPAHSVVGQPIHATYIVHNNLSAAQNISINAVGKVGALQCNTPELSTTQLPGNALCTFTVTVTPDKIGTYQYAKNLQVCREASTQCESYSSDASTKVTAQPAPPPQPGPAHGWVTENKGLPNSLLTSYSTQFNGRVYALSLIDNAWVFTSADAGKTWSYAHSNLPAVAVTSLITVFTHSANQLLLGTTAGLYTSADGVHWQQSPTFVDSQGDPAVVRQIITIDSATYATSNAGSFVSYDGGKTWEALKTQVASGHLSNANIVYDSKSQKTYLYSQNTFTNVADASDTFTANSLPVNASVYYIKGVFYASGSVNFGQDVIYISADDGKTWQKTYTASSAFQLPLKLVSIGDDVYAYNFSTCIQSTNAGQSWFAADFPGVDSTHLVSVDTNGTNDYLNTTSGIYQSNNQGATWTHGGSWAFVTKMVSLNDTLYALTLNGTVYKNVSGTWQALDASGFQGEYITSISANKNTLYASSWDGIIFNSTDGGQSWNSQTLEDPTGNLVLTYGLETKSVAGFPMTTYALTMDGLFINFDNAWTQWGTINIPQNQLPFVSDVTANENSWFLTGTNMDFDENNQMFSSTLLHKAALKGVRDNLNNAFVYKSSDSGATWKPATNGLPVSSPDFLPTKMITVNGNLYLATNEGVYVSQDNSDSWTFLSKATQNKATGVVTQFFYQKGTYYLATLEGLYESSDAKTWTKDNENIGSMPVTSVLITKNGFYATTPLGVFHKVS